MTDRLGQRIVDEAKKHKFKAGHRIRYTKAFLKSSGRATGRLRGEVIDLKGVDGWPRVRWDDMEFDEKPKTVNPANVELDPGEKQHNKKVK